MVKPDDTGTQPVQYLGPIPAPHGSSDRYPSGGGHPRTTSGLGHPRFGGQAFDDVGHPNGIQFAEHVDHVQIQTALQLEQDRHIVDPGTQVIQFGFEALEHAFDTKSNP